MIVNINAVIDELSTVMDKPAAEKLAQVITSLYEQMHGSAVVQRLSAVEQAVHNVGAQLEQVVPVLQGVVEALQHQAQELARHREASEARFARIENTLAELVEAQKRTEETVANLSQRVDELARTQRTMQAQMQEMNNAIRRLAEAQARSEKFLQSVARKQDALAKQWGGLSFSLGYTLENEAYRHLPSLLDRDFGLAVEDRLKRELFEDAQGLIEINIYGTAIRNGERVTIVGESKVQMSRKDVDQFVKRKLPRLQKLFGSVFPVLVTHMTSQIGVKEYANSQGIALYYSYDF